MADLIKFINPDFNVSNIPEVVGDRMYAQDYLRDFQYLKQKMAKGLEWIADSVPLLLTGGVVTQGSGTNLNITAAKGIHKKAITAAQDGSALPPPVLSYDVMAEVESDAQVDLAIPSAVADGVTTNYVKLRHAYSDLNQRTRAKKPGTYYFEVADSFEIVVDDSAPTDYELQLDTFTLTAGGVFTFSGNQSNKTLKLEALNVDNFSGLTVVYDQDSFNAIWERTGANAYKIKDDITSLLMLPLSGGYDCYSASSFLSGGDTSGVFSTNNCLDIQCAQGAYWYVEDTISYVNINSSNTKVDGLDIRGLGTTAVAVQYSIKIDAAADDCVLLNCSVSDRLSNTATYGIYGASNNTVFLSCKVADITSSGMAYGFYQCDNVSSCIASNISSTSASVVYGFYDCGNISSCSASNITSTGATAHGFRECDIISSCTALIISSTGAAYGFRECNNLSGCRAFDIETSSTSASFRAAGFELCNRLSACTADTIAASAANAYAYGFYNCDNLSACLATTVTAVTASRAYGFRDCDWMDGSCHATAIDDFEFSTCSNEPFKSNYLDVVTYTTYSLANFYTYTPAKDGFLFGFFELQGATGTEWRIKEGGYAAARNDADESGALDNSGDASFVMPFMIPVKGGATYYFNKGNTVSIYFTLRFMPFGTTT